MTFFEVEQIEEFMNSLERHLDDWVFTPKDMRMLLKELQFIEKKLQKANSQNSANVTAFYGLVEDLRLRTAACRSSICERLRA